jgi:hypothetical protein
MDLVTSLLRIASRTFAAGEVIQSVALFLLSRNVQFQSFLIENCDMALSVTTWDLLE